MAKKLTVTVNNLGSSQEKCPVCGNAYTPVEYYTGRLVAVNNSRVNLSTEQIERSYANLAEHVGGICLPCAALKEKKKMPRRIITLFIGSILLILGILMEVNRITNGPSATDGLGVILAGVGGIMFLYGIIAIIVGSTGTVTKKATMNKQSLFNYYIDQLGKDGKKWSGLDYLYPGLVKRR